MLHHPLCLLIFSILSLSTTSLKPTTCGSFTPAKWFNSNTNDQITIEYAVPSFSSEYVIPYLYGCRPTMAVAADGKTKISFTYNSQGLVTSVQSSSTVSNMTYFQSPTTQDWWFNSATITSNTAVSLNTFTDNDERIVSIETSAYYQGSQPFYPPHHKKAFAKNQHHYDLFSFKRSILAPLGDMNYYYQGPYAYLASTLNVAWNGIEQVTYTYNYALNNASQIVSLNVTTVLFQDTPFYINYLYHYLPSGVMDYYCVNSCEESKISFGYDSMGRLVNSTSTQDQLLIQYDTTGNMVMVQSRTITWNLTY